MTRSNEAASDDYSELVMASNDKRRMAAILNMPAILLWPIFGVLAAMRIPSQ